MRMTKLRMLLYYLLGLFIMGLTAWLISVVIPLGALLRKVHWFFALLPAILVCVAALVLCCRAADEGPERMVSDSTRRILYRVCYLLNATASGLAVGVLLVEKQISLSDDILVALMPAVLLGLGLYLLMLIPHRIWRKIVAIVFVLLAVVLVVGGIGLWIDESAAQGCPVVFSGLFFLLFPAGTYYAAKHPDHWLRYLAYTGFGAFAVILFVVIFILSEGEILDGLDFDLGSGGGSSKKKQPK